ncbi:alpha/beta hydrolase [bacterium]|nr:alpha/beta hydrolase [bacterium]MBU1063682.1 alpha/beta hydrolase [bacterium]MBU1635094.1 alpha/beta hydrolase [bacterium]MBU1872716.1 alpha/beta hydrolase [bacterium]
MVILAIDQGTTGIRSILFDQDGQIVDSRYMEYTQYYPKPGWVEHDPLNYREGIPARTGLELITAMNRIQVQMETITLPILVMHCSSDKMTNPSGSQELFDAVSSEDKTLKLYNGLIHNDPEKQQVFMILLI